MEHALSLPNVELVPLTPQIAVKATQLGNDFPGDPPNRVIGDCSHLERARLVKVSGKRISEDHCGRSRVIHLDTSVLIKRFVNEKGSLLVRFLAHPVVL